MKILKSISMIVMAVLVMSASSCKSDKYPELGDGLFAEIVTNKGTMVAKLHYDKAPATVANFVALAEGVHPKVEEQYKGKPFFNGLTFHRVMDQFMIQGGDPLGTGRGTPGYRFADEFDETLKHDKPGVLSMANGGPNMNGSQFFITEVPTPWLDNIHSVFGELVMGLEIQDTISNVPTAQGNKPVEDVIIQEVNIIPQGFEARKFDAVKTWEKEIPLLEEKQKQQEEEARKKEEEAQKARDAKISEAAAETLPRLEDYKSKAKESATGLLTYTITKGNGPKPKTGQSVTVNYQGYLTDGRLFDSNIKEVEERYGMFNPQKLQANMYSPSVMQVSPDAGLIPGFKEVLATMRVGDQTYAYIPAHLAWGERGSPPVIPANADVIFIIQMVDIAK